MNSIKAPIFMLAMFVCANIAFAETHVPKNAETFIANTDEPAGITSNVYAGVAGNFEHMFGDRTDGFISSGTTTNLSNKKSISTSEAGFELFLGYLYVFDNSNWAVGIEPFAAWKFNQEDAHYNSGGTAMRYRLGRHGNLGVTFRLGYLLSAVWMVYLLAGPVAGEFRLRYSENGGNNLVSAHKWLAGGRVGLGLDRYFNNFFIGVQAYFEMYGSRRIGDTNSVNGNFVFTKIQPNVFTAALRIGVAY